jgi:TetR/AcrR family transcriptional repressor of nem operon
LGRQTQTRERLVRTAGELFWRQGYAQTGVSSIMKQARATSGSFYHFFPTKDDLLLAVLDAVGELITTDVLDAAEADSDDPFERVSIVIDAYRTRTGPSAPGYGTPIGTLVGELGPDHAAALRRVEKIYTLMVSRITGWFVDSGNRWRSSSEPQHLAEFIVGALEGASMMAIAARSNAPIDACAEQIRFHLDSLAIGRNFSAEEMPPPESSAPEAVDWKSW